MTYAEVENLLARSMGLNAGSIGNQAVRRAVESRMAATNFVTLELYLQELRRSPGELRELIENIVVSETWFFRDREAFTAMVQLHRPREAGQIRILSLPCATGEEPYSIAMTMLNAGFLPRQFRIDAVDISRNALALAQRGLYGKNAFRGGDLAFRTQHFIPEANGHRISDAVKNCVRFEEGNILDTGFAQNRPSYNAIFCRNMLIYFGDAAQNQAIQALLQCLAEDGTLFVGPSETAILLSHGLSSVEIPLSFAYRRMRPSPVAVERPVPVRREMSAARKPPPSRPAFAKPEKPTARVETQSRTLDDIRLMADRGQLLDAALHCESYLTSTGPAAEPLYLLGLIRDAAGATAEAANCYRKVLYLDPSHREAIAHLSLLLEQQGDITGAKRLKERLSRLDRGASQ